MPTALGIWTPRNTTRFYPKRVTPPTIHEYGGPPQAPRPPKKMLTSLDNSSRSTLLEKAEVWLAEAAALEEESKAQSAETLEDQIAKLMFTIDVPLRIRQQERQWDPTGDGTINKGEFRLHLRGIGVTDAPVNQMDDLFDTWDTDKSGAIDMDELAAALKGLHAKFIERTGPRKLDPVVVEKVRALRGRADAAKAAAAASLRAERCAEELAEVTEAIDARLDVQLGALLHKRQIKIGEVVGSWPKARTDEHRGELSKAEFKHEIMQLGLIVGGKPVTPVALGQLFDTIDKDGSGYLDLREAKAALKKWSEWSKEALGEKQSKEAQLKRERALAAGKIQAALRPTDASSPAKRLSTISEGSAAPADPATGPAGAPAPTVRRLAQRPKLSLRGVPGSLAGVQQLLSSRRGGETAEYKKAAQERAAVAVRRLTNRRYAKGLTQWQAFAEETRARRQLLRKSLTTLSQREMARGWRRWRDEHLTRVRLIGLLVVAARQIMQMQLLRGLRGWVAAAALQREEQDRERQLRMIGARIRNPRLVRDFGTWVHAMRVHTASTILGSGARPADAGKALCEASGRATRAATAAMTRATRKLADPFVSCWTHVAACAEAFYITVR